MRWLATLVLVCGFAIFGLLWTYGNPFAAPQNKLSSGPTEVTISKEARYCVFMHQGLVKLPLALSYKHDPLIVDEQRQIKQIVLYADVRRTFDVFAGKVPNAAALAERDPSTIDPSNGKRFIVFHPQYLAYLREKMKTQWAEVGVLAHEVGHHLAGHAFEPPGNQRYLELQADWYSGYLLNKMGASLPETQRVLQVDWPVDEQLKLNASHPPNGERLAAITNGWHHANCEAKERCDQDALGPFQKGDGVKDPPFKEEIKPAWLCRVHGEHLLVTKQDKVYWQKHPARRDIVIGTLEQSAQGKCSHLLSVALESGLKQTFCGRPSTSLGNSDLLELVHLERAKHSAEARAGLCVPCGSDEGSGLCPDTL